MKLSPLLVPAIAVVLCFQTVTLAESADDKTGQSAEEQQNVTVPPKRKYPRFGSKQEKIEWLRYEIERLKTERNYDTQEIERHQSNLNVVQKQLRQLRLQRHQNKVQILVTAGQIQKFAGQEE